MAGMSKTVSIADRLAARSVLVDSGCIEWTGYILNGYGRIRVAGRREMAHRVAFASANGPLADGVCVLHRCDNPKCINPDHLFAGTRADNNADKTTKGRQARGKGHGVPGARSHFAKLTEKEVEDIRSRVGTTQRAIAKEYGISQPNVSKIINQKSWSQA